MKKQSLRIRSWSILDGRRGREAALAIERILASGALQCESGDVEVTKSDVAGIPRPNVRVSCEEFAAVWRAAVELDRTRVRDDDWYPAAVALTCRWLAAAPTRSARGGGLTRSPATRRAVLAYEELIEAEWLAAEQLESRRPDLDATRPGWCEAVRATLGWAWKRNGVPPVPLPAAIVGG